MIVETNWPAVCDTQAAPLSEPTIPVSVEGQITWTKDIVTVLNKVNLDYHNKSLGIIYWEPGWIGNPALGSFCAVCFFLYILNLPASDCLLHSRITFW